MTSILIHPGEVRRWAAALKGFAPSITFAAGELRSLGGLNLPPEARGLLSSVTGRASGLLGDAAHLVSSSSQLAAGMADAVERADAGKGMEYRLGKAGTRVVDFVADGRRDGGALLRAFLDSIEKASGMPALKVLSDVTEWRKATRDAYNNLAGAKGRGGTGLDLLRASVTERGESAATRAANAFLTRPNHPFGPLGRAAARGAPVLNIAADGTFFYFDTRRAVKDPSAGNILSAAGSTAHLLGDGAGLLSVGSAVALQPEVAVPAAVASAALHGVAYGVEGVNAVGQTVGLWRGAEPEEDLSRVRPYSQWEPFGPAPRAFRGLGP